MIGNVSTRLREWVHGALGPVGVSFRAPESEGSPGVGLYLLDLLPSVPPNEYGWPGRPAVLRYLVTCNAPSPQEERAMLDKLKLAAREHPEFAVDPTPLPGETWMAVRVLPPSFLLHVPAPRARVQLAEPVAPEPDSGWVLEGRVVGPGGRSLPEALVAAAPLRLATQTDDHGRFRFANVPASVGRVQMCVQADGRVAELSVELPAPSLVIHLE